jgi:acetyl esterase/lipase
MNAEASPSLQARILCRILRLTMKRRALHEMSADDIRLYFENRRGPVDLRGVDIERLENDHVVGEWVRPKGAPRDDAPTILYLHGGAYVFGSPRLYRTLTPHLAQAAGANLFALSYRLAPEAKCPAAIEDALAAVKWLLAEGVVPERLAIGGDSAGGGLTLATLQALRDRGGPMPACAFVFSPWTDLAATGASVSANAEADCMFQEASIREGGRRYAGALDLKDPRVSPLYGDFRGLPPLLIFASRAEMLFDDAARVAEKAAAAGVDVRFEPRAGLNHVWPLLHRYMPEAQADVKRAGEFVRKQTNAPAIGLRRTG